MSTPAKTQPADVAPPEEAVVTGASGWLGQNLVRDLAADRSRVRCLVRTDEEAGLLGVVSDRIETVVGDVRDPVALDRLFDGVGRATVFHAAAVIHPAGRTRELFDVNVGGTGLVLDRARRAGVHRFVHVSSNSPFGFNPDPGHRFTEDSPYAPYLAYGRSKHEAELLVQRAHDRGDVETVVLRPPWFYGPHQPERQTRFLATVRRGRFPMVGDGRQRRSMVYTGNLVHGLRRAEVAAGAPGNAYWIADPQPYELAAILDTVRAAFVAEGMPVTARQPRLPRLAGRVAVRVDTALQAAGRYLQPVHVLGELGETIACDVARARDELGYEPTTSLLDGMRASIRWCRERGHAV